MAGAFLLEEVRPVGGGQEAQPAGAVGSRATAAAAASGPAPALSNHLYLPARQPSTTDAPPVGHWCHLVQQPLLQPTRQLHPKAAAQPLCPGPSAPEKIKQHSNGRKLHQLAACTGACTQSGLLPSLQPAPPCPAHQPLGSYPVLRGCDQQYGPCLKPTNHPGPRHQDRLLYQGGWAPE